MTMELLRDPFDDAWFGIEMPTYYDEDEWEDDPEDVISSREKTLPVRKPSKRSTLKHKLHKGHKKIYKENLWEKTPIKF